MWIFNKAENLEQDYLDMQKSPERILVRSTNWIGDAVMTTPALRLVRRRFPEAAIFLLAKPWLAPVFENNPHLDHILIYDSKGVHKGPAGIIRLAKELRRYRFDIALLFQNAVEAAVIAFLSGIPERIGFDTDGRGLLLTRAIPCTPFVKSIPQTRYYMEILRGMGLGTGYDHTEIFVTPAEKKHALKLLADRGVSGSRPIVGINPGAAYGTAKRWLPERFVELCIRLRETHGTVAVVFGGPDEAELGKWIRKKVGRDCIDFCGKTGLREAIALINECRVFVTNDSGLMHIAAALGVPLAAVFGSTDHTTTSPSGENSRIIREPTPCAPCLLPDCPTDHRCMKAVTTDRVFAVTRELLLKQNPD